MFLPDIEPESVSFSLMKVLMHAFISSWLDYCNVLLTRTRVLNGRGPSYLSVLLLVYQFSGTLKSSDVCPCNAFVISLLLYFTGIHFISSCCFTSVFSSSVSSEKIAHGLLIGLLSLIMAWMALELYF